MSTYNNYAWISPTGKFVQENAFLFNMAKQYVDDPREAMRKLNFLEIINCDGVLYGFDQDIITRQQKNWTSQNKLNFVARTENEALF